MPWRTVTPMDEKLLFIADYLRGAHKNFTQLCRLYGISRKTGYKWVSRYEQQGMDGLDEQSRRPRQSPLRTPYVIRQAIIELRTSSRSPPGAKKLQALLVKRFPHETPPSLTTIYTILHDADLVRPRKKRSRVMPYAQPFSPVQAPNELWSVDYKGQMKLANGRWCYPLTVMDHDSRYLLGCQGLEGTTYAATRDQFIRLFREYGLPQRIRSDNGTPFASRAAGGLSRLSVWWVRLGIRPERIEPGKPQQNGRHERMHRTLKHATAKPPASSLAAQQRRFDTFTHDYNVNRPHESLGQQPPVTHYHSSPREYPVKLPELEYPDYYQRYQVRSNGVIYSHNGQIYVSHLLQGETVGLEEVDDGILDVYYGPIRLGYIDLQDQRGKSCPYWTLKV